MIKNINTISFEKMMKMLDKLVPTHYSVKQSLYLSPSLLRGIIVIKNFIPHLYINEKLSLIDREKEILRLMFFYLKGIEGNKYIDCIFYNFEENEKEVNLFVNVFYYLIKNKIHNLYFINEDNFFEIIKREVV